MRLQENSVNNKSVAVCNRTEMAAKSPTLSLKSREIIGVDQFSQRREVFDKHDTVFLPLPSPTNLAPSYREVEPIVTSNHGKTTTNFKRNAPGYSSMRESRTDDSEVFEFRTRKYSDNFTSELNQSDDVDYRRSMTDRTRRLSKLRRDFLTSNLHEPTNESPFARVGVRASMPVRSGSINYKIESPNLFKFPFAEPYATPPPVRKVVVDLGPTEVDNGKENKDQATFRTKIVSLPDTEALKKHDHQKMFEELVKRYSPQRKPVDWKIPPTRPRIVDSVPKLTTPSMASVDSSDSKKNLEDKITKPEDEDVFNNETETETETSLVVEEKAEDEPKDIMRNGPDTVITEAEEKLSNHKERDSKVSLTELAEKNDEVPELSIFTRQLSRESAKRPPIDKIIDLTIPDLLEKMTVEGDDLELKKDLKKVKRKRSFLDKLLGRNKKEK